MTTPRTAGRIVGILILAQMVFGILDNFVLTASLFGAPGFLVAASAHAGSIATSVLLGLTGGLFSVVIAVATFRVAREQAPALALGLLALATASLAAAVVEQSHVMSMLSLSQAYAKAPADAANFQGLRMMLAATRNWSHFLGLVVTGLMLVVFYATLFRAALVPRALAVVGLTAALLQVVVVARPLFGLEVIFPLLAPLGLSQLALSLWLLVRGYPERAAGVG
jgi:hypothetical protein